MKARVDFLKNKQQENCALSKSQNPRSEGKELQLLEKTIDRKREVQNKQFRSSLERSTLNSLKLRATPFLERQFVYQADSSGNLDSSIDFVFYDFMHIRVKPQSTRFYRASPTANSIPKYVIVAITSQNILYVYESPVRMQKYFKN